MNNLKQKFDASTVAIMWQALNEVVADHRFSVRKSVTPLKWRNIFFSKRHLAYATSTI